MYMDYNSVLRDSPYNRYITRWHLEKAEPKFTLSPPKQPIVFWLENTIRTVEYREAVKEGILASGMAPLKRSASKLRHCGETTAG